MQNDREVVLEAVKNNGDALEYASEELKNDKEILLEASKTGNHVFDHASKDFSNDREIVLRAVQTDYSLSFASEELRDDREIVLEAVTEYGTNLEYASERLKKDKEIVLIAVLSSRGKAIEYVSEELQEEMELLILKGIEPKNEEMKHEIKKLRENYELAYRLVIKDINNLRFFKDSKFYNKDFILLVLENAELMFDTNIIENLKEELKEDEEIVLEVLRTYESEFVYLSDKLKNSKEFISKAIEINPYIRGYIKDYDFS